jgi:hypothetical protein
MIYAEQYQTIAKIGFGDEKVKSLQMIPQFLDTLNFSSCANFFKLLNFDKGEIILQQGIQLTDMFWLISGKCYISMNVPLMRKEVTINREKSKWIIRKCAVNETPQANEVYFMENLRVGMLQSGASFPSIPNLEKMNLENLFLMHEVDKSKYLAFFNDMNPSDPRTWSQCSIVADSNCVLAVVQFPDFITIAPSALILELMRKPPLGVFPLEKVQEAFINSCKWKAHKQSIVNEIIG